MKRTKEIILTLTVFFLGIGDVLCKSEVPPPPPPTSRVTAVSAFPPPPDGLPVNENIFILIIIAILLGVYIIYNHNLKTKTPT